MSGVQQGSDVPVTVPRSSQHVVASEAGLAYELRLAWPVVPPPPTGYPVIYLLDADTSFGTCVEAIRMRAPRVDATNVTAAVVAGIAYSGERPAQQRRQLDYTEPPLQAAPGQGGAPAFRAFLEERIKPVVAARLPINTNRQTIVGHSLAGRFVLDTLCASPTSFDTYVAISPSVWASRQQLFDALDGAGAALRTRHVMIGVGEYEERLAPWQVGQPGTAAIAERRQERGMVRDARRVAARLSDLCARVSFEEFPQEDHASVLLVALSRALRFALAPRA